MIRILVVISFLLLSGFAFAQNSKPNYLFVKFDTYSIKEDQLIQTELAKEKIIYTCIPSGILVFEVMPNDSTAEVRIAAELKKVTLLPSFQFISDMTLADAESSCSSFRKPE